MVSPNFRSSPEPVRNRLVEVRRGLLRLHKTLIDSERAVFERSHGPMTNGQFLQALIEEPFFAWLRPFSGLIVQIDEALHAKEPVTEPGARSFIEQVRALVGDGEAAERYELVCRRDADVLLAHVELTSRIDAASELRDIS